MENPVVHARQRARLSDQLIIYFAREIVGERLRAGDLLPPEAELAEKFGISKVVARESLHALASFNLIHKRQGKRSVVLDRSEWNALIPVIQQAYWLEGHAAELLRQLYELRLAIEPTAAARTADRGTPQDFDRLDELVEDMRTIAQTSQDIQAFLQIDRAFHDSIARATGNVVLRGIMRGLHSSLSGGWSRSKLTAEELALVAEQHAQIARSIRRRDPDGSRRTMEAHVRWAERIETDRVKELPTAGRAPETLGASGSWPPAPITVDAKNS